MEEPASGDKSVNRYFAGHDTLSYGLNRGVEELVSSAEVAVIRQRQLRDSSGRFPLGCSVVVVSRPNGTPTAKPGVNRLTVSAGLSLEVVVMPEPQSRGITRALTGIYGAPAQEVIRGSDKAYECPSFAVSYG